MIWVYKDRKNETIFCSPIIAYEYCRAIIEKAGFSPMAENDFLKELSQSYSKDSNDFGVTRWFWVKKEDK